MIAIMWCASRRCTVISAAAIAAIQKLDAISNHLELRTLLTVFIIPIVELESSFDETGATFSQILADQFRRTSPGFDVDEGDFIFHLTVTTLEPTIDGQTEVGYRLFIGKKTHLRISGKITTQEHTVNGDRHVSLR